MFHCGPCSLPTPNVGKEHEGHLASESVEEQYNGSWKGVETVLGLTRMRLVENFGVASLENFTRFLQLVIWMTARPNVQRANNER